MKKLLISVIILTVAFCTLWCIGLQASAVTATATTKSTDLSKLENYIYNEKAKIKATNTILKNNKVGSKVYNIASKDKKIAEANLAYYQKRYDKMAKYKTATYVWNYLKSKGYNKYVRAGILGNMMAETGGQTLAIKYHYYDGYYYGLVNWSLYYYPSTYGMSLRQQMDYLHKTMPKEFREFGSNYYYGFNVTKFKNLKNERSAALAFAKCYERCWSGSYYIRQVNATKALNYYTK